MKIHQNDIKKNNNKNCSRAILPFQ